MIIIKTSSDKKSVLEDIAKVLLKDKIAGCINLIPGCTSLFSWDNKLNKNTEHLIMIKTIKENEQKVYNIIKKMHNYEIPEIITLNVQNIDKDYKKWMKEVMI